MDKEKDKLNVKEKEAILKYIIVGLVGIIIGLLVGYIALNNKKSSKVSNENISTYTYESTILKGDEKTAACDKIINKLDSMKSDNTYLQVQVGEDSYDTYIYNKNGECFAQSYSGAYTAVTRSDGAVVKLDMDDEAIIVESDIDMLSLMRNVASLAKDKKDITFYDMVMSEDSDTIEYRIDVIGMDNFKALYSTVNNELADIMEGIVLEEFGEDWEPHFIYCYLLDGDDITLYCYSVADGEECLNWVSQGYLTLSDWKLDDTWYSDDIANLEYDTVYDMLYNLIGQLEQVIQNYALENGLITEEDLAGADEVEIGEPVIPEESTENSETETVENNTETAEENTETVEENTETVEENTETVEENTETVEDNNVNN